MPTLIVFFAPVRRVCKRFENSCTYTKTPWCHCKALLLQVLPLVLLHDPCKVNIDIVGKQV